MIVSNLDNNGNNKFTIQYTKEELDKIQHDFVTQINKYISRVNNRILKTMEEIVHEVETVPPPTVTTIIVEQQKEEVL
jgi:hypothetical protein